MASDISNTKIHPFTNQDLFIMRTTTKIFSLLLPFFLSSSIVVSQLTIESYWGGGKSNSVTLSESYAFFGFGSILYCVNSETYQLAGSYRLPAPISDLAVAGNILFAGANNGGLYVLDVTDPKHISETAHFTHFAYQLLVTGNRLYVARLVSGVAVFDISVPAYPQLLSELDTEANIYDIVANGNFLYGAGSIKGLVVIDQSTSGVLTEREPIPSSRPLYHLIYDQNRIYATSDANAGMDIFNVQEPGSPILENSFTSDDPLGEMQVLGDILWVGGFHEGIRKFSLANPMSPVEIGRHDVGTVVRFALNKNVLCTVDDQEGAFLYPVEGTTVISQVGDYELDFQAMDMYAIGQSHLYIPEMLSQYEEKIKIIDLTDPLHPVEQGYLNLAPEALVAKEDIAYILKGYKLHIIDISIPDQPNVLGSIQLSAEQRSLTLYKDWLFAYSYGIYDKKGLNVIDISDPVQPMEINYLAHSSSVSQLGITDSALFVTDAHKQLYRVDFRDPDAAVFESQAWYPDSIDGCWVRNGIGYFTDVHDSLRIYDLSDPFYPQMVSSTYNGSLKSQPLFKDQVAYVTSFQGMDVYDFSDPYFPRQAGFVDIPGYYTSPALVHDWLIVSKVIFEQKLSLFDVSNPFQPVRAGQFAPIGRNVGIDQKGDMVFVANELGGLQVLDMSEKTALKKGVLHTKGKLQALDLMDDHVYLAVEGEGMQIVDVSNAAKPNPKGIYHPATNSSVNDIAVEGDIACLIGGTYGITILDVSDKLNPVVFAKLAGGWNLQSACLHDGLLYLCQSGAGIQVLDLANPADPVVLGTYDTPGDAMEISFRDDTAYLADGRSSLRLLAVSDPSNINEISSINLAPAFVNAVDVLNGYALVTGSFMGLYLIDVNDPAAMKIAGRFFVSGNEFNGVKVDSGFVYASCENTGIYKFSSELLTTPIDTTTSDVLVTEEWMIEAPFPNPFDNQVIIRYSLQKRQQVTIDIFDLNGEKIKTLVDEELPYGQYVTVWRGESSSGFQCPPGTYVCRYRIGQNTVDKKLVLLY